MYEAGGNNTLVYYFFQGRPAFGEPRAAEGRVRDRREG